MMFGMSFVNSKFGQILKNGRRNGTAKLWAYDPSAIVIVIVTWKYVLRCNYMYMLILTSSISEDND